MIKYYDNGTYNGSFRFGKRHGKGVYTWTNGDKYDGAWINDERTGKGVYIWQNGDKYEGDFVNAKLHGKGIYTWPNGDKYEGDFSYGVRTGKGVFIWPNGDRYEGDFIDDKRAGHGVIFWPNGDKYEAFYNNDEKTHGLLKAYLINGEHQLGLFNNGELIAKHLDIKELESADYRYIGGLKDGLRDGVGECFFNDGGYYAGQWKNDIACGFGVAKYADGSNYDGYFEDNKFHGKGKHVRANGDVYDGEWQNSDWCGNCKIFWKEYNISFEGYYGLHGSSVNGKLTYSDGSYLEGFFNTSWKLEGKGKHVQANGDIYDGEWKKGEWCGDCKIFWKSSNITFEGFYGVFGSTIKGKLTYADGTVKEGTFNKSWELIDK